MKMRFAPSPLIERSLDQRTTFPGYEQILPLRRCKFKKETNSQTANDTPRDDSLSASNNNIYDGHNPNDFPVLPANDHSIAGGAQMDGTIEKKRP